MTLRDIMNATQAASQRTGKRINALWAGDGVMHIVEMDFFGDKVVREIAINVPRLNLLVALESVQ